MKRILGVPAVLALVSSLLIVAPSVRSTGTPVAVEDATYEAYGRVFPDPHGCLAGLPGMSPWAKGNICAADFIQFDEMVAGLGFLQEKFPGFIDLFRLDERYANPEYMSAGLATADLSHEPNPLWMIRVTDESIPDEGKKHFVFPLSIHGIERAGAEGGIRAVEDLATWAACEKDADASPICANEGQLPHPILETSPADSITAGEALKKSAVYFMFPNPDGWRRGDRDNGSFYQRFNGNGIDLNRDWPSLGYVFGPYTPFSEPESKAFGEVLKQIRSTWDGSIDLHGQLIDRAFSFTLLGQGPRDFGSNQRTLDVVEGAWRDAETRLSWSTLIKPNDAPADDQRMYGVQWGTVWDTIGYTTTGALGDWIGSPLGLNADVAIDNEMSLSHISNCGIGSCFVPEIEQLHVDGNKSLVYSMINFTFRPEDTTFRTPGRIAFLDNQKLVASVGAKSVVPPLPNLEPQKDIVAQLDPTNGWTHEFDLLGPSKNVFNRGFKVTLRALNVAAVSPNMSTLVAERQVKGDEWEVVNSHYNQGGTYQPAGQTVDVNEPEPGHWRVRVVDAETDVMFRATVDFRDAPAWPNPVQLPYSATNSAFFKDLNRYAERQLAGVTADSILTGLVDLNAYDSLVIADDVLPGYTEPLRTGDAQAAILLGAADVSNPTYPCASPTSVDPPPPGCEGYVEWTVDGAKNNQSMAVRLEWLEGANDFDLYIERFAERGAYWTPVAQSAGGSNPEIATLLKPVPGKYRARIVNWASAEPLPQELEVTFSNDTTEVAAPSSRTDAQLKAFASKLRAFVEAGGNLILTDSALRLLASMGIVDRTEVHDFSVYAGYIGFTPDGSAATYDIPLARNVQRPGAAEGPGHRHQTYEPVPLGFAIQAEAGGDASTSPVWAVDQTVWEKLKGVTAGTTTGDQVTLGELKLGKGVVRIIGALLPMPTDRYFHPYGLANYSVTYAGYQVFQNATDYKAPARTAVLPGKQVRPRPNLPATGVGETAIVLGVALFAGALSLTRWRRRTL